MFGACAGRGDNQFSLLPYLFVLDMDILFTFRGSTRWPTMWTIDRLLFYEWSGVNWLYRPICTDALSLHGYELYCLLLLLFVNMIGK